MSKNEKYLHGRKEGVKTDQGKMVRNGTPKMLPGGGAKCESGSHNEELTAAAHGIYQKAVKNGGGSGEIGDKAIKTR
jgi:hypothetical protein